MVKMSVFSFEPILMVLKGGGTVKLPPCCFVSIAETTCAKPPSGEERSKINRQDASDGFVTLRNLHVPTPPVFFLNLRPG